MWNLQEKQIKLVLSTDELTLFLFPLKIKSQGRNPNQNLYPNANNLFPAFLLHQKSLLLQMSHALYSENNTKCTELETQEERTKLCNSNFL